MDNNTCSCSEGYDGTMCNDTSKIVGMCCSQYVHIIVMQECQEDFCLNGATCQIVAGEYLCICAEEYAGPDCGMHLMFDKCVSAGIFAGYFGLVCCDLLLIGE